MEVETIFAVASTLALLVGFVFAGSFLSPRFGAWMARRAARVSPRLGRLFRDGLSGRDSR
jgi:hypothetical protein